MRVVRRLDGTRDAPTAPITPDHQIRPASVLPVRKNDELLIKKLVQLLRSDVVDRELFLVNVVKKEGVNLDHRPIFSADAPRCKCTM